MEYVINIRHAPPPIRNEMKEVASIGVLNAGKLLMGKRRDNGRWTLPGGHLEINETPHWGACRELAEEAGIDAHQLDYLGTELVTTFTGQQIKVHAFIFLASPKTTTKKDPDQEVEVWKWIDCKNGLPKKIADNLHSPKNVVLKYLGLQNYEVEKSATSMKSRIESLRRRRSPIPPTAEKSITLQLTSPQFLIDLIKADGAPRANHKYLRRFKGERGEWQYVYHEGNAPGRAISPEAVVKIKKLAALGHDESHALHSTLEDHRPEKIAALRELAALGHQPAKDHLTHLAIPHEAPEKKEESLDVVLKEQDKIERELKGPERNAALAKITAAVKVMTDRLTQHGGPLQQALATRGITAQSIMQEVGEKKSLKDMLGELHKQMNGVDLAHRGLSSSFDQARDAGGYGNLVYKTAVKNLEGGLLPEGYSSIHERGTEMPKVAEIERKLERKRAEEREREEREIGELRGSMAYSMAGMMTGRGIDRVQEARKIDTVIKSIFGESLKAEHFPYDFSAKGITVKIERADIGRDSMRLSMAAFDASGNRITDGWTRTWDKDGGKPHIYNDFLATNADARGNHRIGSLINQAQRKLMKEHSRGGTVTVTAALGVGGYNWANQGFSFKNGPEEKRSEFQRFARDYGISLTREHLEHFTEPCHFAAFDDGKNYEKTRLADNNGRLIYMPLSPQQIKTRSLSGVAGEFPLTEQEISSGKANRISVNLGKLFLLGRSWKGSWKSGQDTIANKYAEAYAENKKEASAVLGEHYISVMKQAKSGTLAAPSGRATSRESTQSNAPPSSVTPIVQSMLRSWASSRTGRITLTQARLRRIGRMHVDDIRIFYREAGSRLSPQGRARLREIMARTT